MKSIEFQTSVKTTSLEIIIVFIIMIVEMFQETPLQEISFVYVFVIYVHLLTSR